MPQHHVIYVPGIRDDVYKIQSTLIKLWRIYGVHGHCHEIPWFGQEDYKSKVQRLLDEIDEYADAGYKVSLIGASAGASAVLNAYVERKEKISGLIYIVAKINGPDTVSKRTYQVNPAFKTSMYLLQDNLKRIYDTDKSIMRSYYSPVDKVIPYKATVIMGVEEKALPKLRHGFAIIYSLSLGVRPILNFLKSTQSV
jgi:pimeloyl-ACP methyl ester carboxylesterase